MRKIATKTPAELTATLRILRYLRGTSDQILRQERAHAAFLSANPARQVARTFCDANGANRSRPGLAALENAMRAGEGDIVLVADLSRLHRNLLDHIRFQLLADRCGLEIHSLADAPLSKNGPGVGRS
jgi:DNA invertase Pin-like site-specific DNA recombinase